MAQFMISEAEAYRSRDEVVVTVPANTTYEAGTIMGIVTANQQELQNQFILPPILIAIWVEDMGYFTNNVFSIFKTHS